MTVLIIGTFKTIIIEMKDIQNKLNDGFCLVLVMGSQFYYLLEFNGLYYGGELS